jgi:myo-inositol-1(or 4)-monophosphatase
METKILNTALEAAEEAADYLLKGYGGTMEVSLKGIVNPVTDRDYGAEKIIGEIISKSFHDHQILAEEGGLSGPRSRFRWYVDPIDGTANYARGHPFFAVSLCCALLEPNLAPRPLVAVIRAPVLRELFWAVEGGGAFYKQELSDRVMEGRMKVSKVDKVLEALVNTGFPYDLHERLGEILGPLGRVVGRAMALRRAGAASLDMAYVALGRADCYYEFGIKPWDVAAGLLLVSEAGGVSDDLEGGLYNLDRSQSIIAGNKELCQRLTQILQGETSSGEK